MAFSDPKGAQGPVLPGDYANMHSLPRYSHPVGGWRPTTVAGERKVSIAAGPAVGLGIYVETDAAEIVDIPTPDAGRWYLGVCRRTWTEDGVDVEFALNYGPTTSTTPPAGSIGMPTSWLPYVEQAPGDLDEEPLFWVWARSTDTTMVIFDLRLLVDGRHGWELRSSQNLAGTGGIINPNGSVNADHVFLLPEGRLVSGWAQVQLWLPSNIAGTIKFQLDGNDIPGSNKHWHNHGRANIYLEPISVFQEFYVPAGGHTIRAKVETEASSSGPLEIWDFRSSISAV